MDFEFFLKYYSYFVSGAGITLWVSFFGVFCGVILGVVLSLMKLSKKSLIRIIASSYIELVRGTPLMVQVFLVYYGVPMIVNLPFTRLSLGIVAISLNSAAYVAEIIRAGILSIDKGQMEAARSLGMTHTQAMRHIIVPQAFKNILPALGNEFIVLIKESAILSVVGIHDLMYNADTLRGITYRPFIPLVYVTMIYFVITFSLSKLLGIFERRMRASD